jgi:hypothetical protein
MQNRTGSFAFQTVEKQTPAAVFAFQPFGLELRNQFCCSAVNYSLQLGILKVETSRPSTEFAQKATKSAAQHSRNHRRAKRNRE